MIAKLRVGWTVGPRAHVASLWSRKDYTSIAPTALGDALAALALRSDVRAKLLERTRRIVRDNWSIVERRLGEREELGFRAPDAGAIVWVRHRGPETSLALAETMRSAHGVLVVPGEHFALNGYVRLGFGLDPGDLEAALERVVPLLGNAAHRT